MYRILISESINALSEAIRSLGWEIPDEIKVEEPPNPELGDVASSVSFQLAKELKRSPNGNYTRNFKGFKYSRYIQQGRI